MKTHRRFHGEQGASLVLALVFLTIFSLVAVSTLGLAGAGFQTTTVTRDRVDDSYATDAGVEHAVQKLVTDEWCISQHDEPAEFTIPAPVNGEIVEVTCQTTEGGRSSVGLGSPLIGGYVAVIGSGGVSVQGGGWGPAEIHGNMYSAGPMDITWQDPGSCQWFGAWYLSYFGFAQPEPNVCAWIDVEGSLTVAGSECPPAKVYPTGPCTANEPPPTVATPTAWIPPNARPAIDLLPYGVDCVILYPGRYGTKPTFNANRKYYLASGTYYFANSSFSGDIVLQGQIVGGMPSQAEPWEDTPQVSGLSSCAGGIPGFTPDELASYVTAVLGGGFYDSATAGTGVALVRGSSAKLRVSGANTKAEFFTRVPAAGSPDATTPGITFWANTSTQGTTGGSYAPVPNNCGAGGCEIFITTDNQVDVVFHGLSYLPNSAANLLEPFNAEVGSGSGTVSFFLGGLVAKRLTVTRNFDNNIQRVSLAGTGEPILTFEPRTTTVTARLTDATGAPIEVIAIVRPDQPGGPEIVSWRRV